MSHYTLTPKLTELDRCLFTALVHASPEAPADLATLAGVAPERSLEEVSDSLGRLKLRGLIGELAGRHFFAPILVGEPIGFTPLAASEWAGAAQ